MATLSAHFVLISLIFFHLDLFFLTCDIFQFVNNILLNGQTIWQRESYQPFCSKIIILPSRYEYIIGCSSLSLSWLGMAIILNGMRLDSNRLMTYPAPIASLLGPFF